MHPETAPAASPLPEALPTISVVIPTYNTSPARLRALQDSLLAQTHQAFEVLLVDDCSDQEHYDTLRPDPRFRLLRKDKNCGPATSRNMGAAETVHEFVFFTDDDCVLAPGTLAQAAAMLSQHSVSMGDTVTHAKTQFGRAVALLGFPGGGCIGFHNVWKVEGGCTASVSSCNLAIRKDVFLAMGGFDASFPVPGGEDTVFARALCAAGVPIRYAPEQRVFHEERSDWRGFVRWMKTRGRGNYHIKQKLGGAGKVGGYLRLRLWSFGNSLRAAPWHLKPLVLLLIGAAVYYQSLGYKEEAARQKASPKDAACCHVIE